MPCAALRTVPCQLLRCRAIWVWGYPSARAPTQEDHATEEGARSIGKLDGKKIAILATDGVEQVELTEPREALEAEGATTSSSSLEAGEIQGFNHLDHADKLPVDKTVDVSADDYDGVLSRRRGQRRLPARGRGRGAARGRLRRAHKPIASICHGPWILVEAGIVKGRTVTSWPSLQTDIRNAGGTWVDEEVHVDQGLVTSRKPDDIPAFSAKAVEEFAEGARRHAAAVAARRPLRRPHRNPACARAGGRARGHTEGHGPAPSGPARSASGSSPCR